jgi:hypothetical protein
MSRGVLFIAWEAADVTAARTRAVAALHAGHPALPHHVVTLPGAPSALGKARLPALSPFETTAYLDDDALVLGRLDFGFEMAERYGLACCLGDNPWRRRHVGIADDALTYDTGVLFFTATAQPVFDMWGRLAPLATAPVAVVEDLAIRQEPGDDGLGFAQALEACGVAPLVLPPNWSLRPRWRRSFYGPVRIWHGDTVPEPVRALNRYYDEPDAIIQFHELAG